MFGAGRPRPIRIVMNSSITKLFAIARLALRRECFRQFSHASRTRPRVAIVGSGPAGFGIAQFLLKNHSKVHVSMIEKNPVPYGLIRYGVSPDHQDVKNCINGYEKLADNPRFSYYGGIEVGKTISLKDIMEVFDGAVMCYGAQEPMYIGIPGENLHNVFTAKEFVGWYNGEEEHRNISPDLTGDTAVIIGVGNVALDCARMLLKPVTQLRDTDITQYSFQNLKESNIRNVILVGRRGPLQMACTRRELSEITDIGDVATNVSDEYFTEEIHEALKIKNLKLRKTQRLVKHLLKSAELPNSAGHRNFNIKLLRTPIQIHGDNKVESVDLQKNVISGGDAFSPEITATNDIETIPCSLIISAIGYSNRVLDDRLPNENGRIVTTKGRIDFPFPLYSCGWCRTGPKGVLADTLNDCLLTGKNILNDLESGMWRTDDVKHSLDGILVQKHIRYYTWQHWKCIDAYEIESGAKLGKVREKIVSRGDMESVAFDS